METETQMTEETAPQPRSSRHRGESNATPGFTLGPRDQLIGRLVYEGELRVQGTLEGEAVLQGDLNVDGDATVKAKVEVRNLTVRGALEGEATVRERLLIAGSGAVSGNVRVGRLVIEDGATLNGSVSMERNTGGSPNGRAQGEG